MLYAVDFDETLNKSSLNKIFDPNLKKEDLNLSRVITEEPEEVVQTETEAVAASE